MSQITMRQQTEPEESGIYFAPQKGSEEVNECRKKAMGGNTTTRNRSGNVQISDNVEVVSWQHDMRPAKEKWYQKPDYTRFQAEKKETLRHFRQAQARFHNIDDNIFCLRGFEAYLSVRAIQQKLVRRVAASQVVMEIQHHQRRQGRDDPREMRLEYHRTTASARKLALKRAVLDANEVKTFHCSETRGDDVSVLNNQVDRLLAIKSGHIQPALRPPTSGPLCLRKTVSSTA